MSANPVQAGLVLLIGLMVVGAIFLAFAGLDPTIAVDMILPIFVIGIFVALGIGLFNAASG